MDSILDADFVTMPDCDTILPANASRETWLQMRRHGFGSTDSAAILGVSPWRTAIDVWLDKRGLAPEQAASRRMKRGLRLEPVIAEEYEEETGCRLSIPPRLVRSRATPWLQASLDRLDDEPAIVELKYSERKSEWGESGTDEVPEHYLIQAQHQMAVTGLALVKIVAFLPDELRIFPIQRHQSLIDLILDSTRDMQGLIQRGEMPSLDWSHPRTVEAVKRMYGVRDAWEVNLGDEAAALAKDYLEAGAIAKAADRDREEAKGKLLLLMGEAASASLPDGTVLTRRKVSRREYVCKATDYIQFRVKTPKGKGDE